MQERVTRSGAGFGARDLDGQTLVFQRAASGSALLAVPLSGGPEKTLVPCVRGAPGFDVARSRVYYASCVNEGDPLLHVFEPTSGGDLVLGRLDAYSGGLAVSRDGETIAYLRAFDQGSDLMMIENFR
jgi:hypothetical protein